MAPTVADHFSSDLLWEITKGWNSFQVKRRSNGGSDFSKDPYNLTNKQTRKHTGFINDQAIGITHGEKGGVVVTTKKSGSSHKPGHQTHTTNIGGKHSSRKTQRSVVNSTAKRGYRTDLHKQSVARASAIRNSQRVKKDTPAPKARGTKAKAAAAS